MDYIHQAEAGELFFPPPIFSIDVTNYSLDHTLYYGNSKDIPLLFLQSILTEHESN